MCPLASIPTYATGDTIEASWANTLRDNGLVLDARTGGDPGAAFANKFLAASGLLSGAWRALVSGDFPASVVPDTALATPKVTRAGDAGITGPLTTSSSLAFTTDGIGETFSAGSNIRDTASPERLLVSLAGARLDVFNEGSTTLLLQLTTGGLFLPIDSTGLILAAGSQLRDTLSPERFIATLAGSRADFFSENGVTLIARLTDSAGLLLPIDGVGLGLSSGSHIVDTASPERLLLTAAGGRMEVFNEGGTVQLLQVDASSFTYKTQGVIHAGNIGSQTVAAAGTATTAGSATSAGSATTAATATNANALGGVAPAGYSLVPTSGIYNGDNSTTTVNTGLGSRLKLVILQKTSGPTSDRTMWIFIGDEAIQLNPGAVVGEVTGTFTTGSFAISLAAGTNVGGQSYKWVAFG
jgi:hypothetical protein